MEKNKQERLKLAIEVITLITTCITAISSVGALITINKQEINTTNQNGYINGNNNIININPSSFHTTDEAMAEQLYYAQKSYDEENYHNAISTYQSLKDTNAIACINLGYFYSNGLGTEVDYKLASKYYLQAYEKFKLEEGLKNYLALNIVTRCDMESAISAIDYGYICENAEIIRFITSLERGALSETISSADEELAKNFTEYPKYKKEEILLNSLRPYKFEAMTLSDEPTSSNYIEYEYMINTLYPTGGVKEVQIGVTETDNIPIYKTINVYTSVKIYLAKYKCFGWSSVLFDENFYKV